ncbi:MAG: IS21 family transposase [Candidatus Thorarchaeota archaeon]|jgi:transposase
MITLEDWVMIKHMHKQGVPKSRIARELGVCRETIRKAISEDERPSGKRQSRDSILDPYKEYINQRLEKYDLTATRILREIQERGYPGSYTVVKRFVREVKGAKPKPAFVRFETSPGEQAQMDWSDFGWVEFDGQRRKLWCFAMVLGYSRTLYLEFSHSQNLVSLGKAHINAFRYFGGVTDTVLYDNMKTVVLSREGNRIHWNPRFVDFALHYGFIPKLCLPGRKETKGKIERPFSYIRSSFFRGTEFISLTDVNEKGWNWLGNVANTRIHGTTQEVPFDRLKDENLSLLRDEAYVLEHWEVRKSHKDCYISFDGNRYSVPYQYSCRDLTVRLRDEELRIFHGDELIASHRLSYQRGRMITDPRHFLGIPKPAYPSGVRAVREVFLVHFPRANLFLDGLVKAKYGNVRYHMLQILNLLADYPVAVVESAIERAMLYGAFECRAIRNICRQGEFPKAKAMAMQEEIELTQKPSVVSESVEERALSYYSQLEV